MASGTHEPPLLHGELVHGLGEPVDAAHSHGLEQALLLVTTVIHFSCESEVYVSVCSPVLNTVA